jgi:hypothetical protein
MEHNFKLVFLISTHTDVLQLARLICALPDNSTFFIHLDKKTDIKPFAEAFADDSRVKFIDHRVDVRWGSINEVEYQMELVRAALNSGEQFERLITLSGMDYPLWNKNRIIQFFEQDQEREYLMGIDLSTGGLPSKRYTEFYLMTSKKRTLRYISSVLLRKLIYFLGIKKSLKIKTSDKSLNLWKGAAWWAISPQLASYILHEWDENTELRKYMRTALCPAELFAQTVAFNSEEWRDKCMEFTDKNNCNLPALTPLTWVAWQGSEIKVLDESDYETLRSSGKMFARKVVTGKSDRLVECIKSAF